MPITRKLIEVENEIFKKSITHGSSKEFLRLLDLKFEWLIELYREIVEPVSHKFNYKVKVKVGESLSQEAGLSPNSLLNWDGPKDAGLKSGFENLYLKDYVYEMSDQPLSFFIWRGDYQNTGGLVLRYFKNDLYDSHKPSLKVFPLDRLGGYVEGLSPWSVDMQNPAKSLSDLIKKYENELIPSLNRMYEIALPL